MPGQCARGGRVEMDAGHVGEADERIGPGEDSVFEGYILAYLKRERVPVYQDKLCSYGAGAEGELEWQGKAPVIFDDRQQLQLSDAAYKNHGSAIGHLPFKAEPPAGFDADGSEFRRYIIWQP